MTDKQWQNIIIKTASLKQEYHKFLKIAEDEFIDRYGKHPSDIDFDSWIDAMHVTGYGILVEEIKREMSNK